MAALRRLRDMPLPDNGATGCTWAGEPFALFDGYGKGTRTIAQVEAGDQIPFSWIGTANASVVGTSRDGGALNLGWIKDGTVDFKSGCTNWAD